MEATLSTDAGGPMTFRFVLQPIMAAIAALHDGIETLDSGAHPISGHVLADPATRARTACAKELDLDGAHHPARPRDGRDLPVSQCWVHSIRAKRLLIALLLAVVPYFLLRGPFDAIARWWRRAGVSRFMANTGN